MNAQEVTIIGGGLAGLALGIGLRRAGVPVTIHEAGRYPRHRVCGEFIAGLPASTIRELGLEDVFDKSIPGVRSRWFPFNGRPVNFNLPEAALGISRFALDAALAARFVAEGGRLLTNCRQEADTSAPGLVMATGRRRRTDAAWVGLKAHVRNVAIEPGELEMHLGRGAYVGLAPVEDGWVNLCGLFRRSPGLKISSPEAWGETLRRHGLPALAGRVAGAEMRAGSACSVAGCVFDHRFSSAPGISIGDAGAMIAPFTGNGMAMAFIGAATALEPLRRWATHEADWAETTARCRDQLARAFRTRLALASALHPLLQGRFRGGVGLALRAGVVPMRSLYRHLH